MNVRQIQAGTTDVSINLSIIDSTDGTPETGVVFDTTGIDLWYRRETEVSTDITEATLAALTTAHTDGGFLHINDGVYRLDLPDAACATGVTGVQIGGTVTGMVVLGPYIELVSYDPYDTVRLGLTALPNAIPQAAGGLITSTAGSLNLDAMNTNINDIETDTADMQPKLGAPSADLAADIAAIKAETVLIVADTNELQVDDVPGLIAALNDLSAAQVNTEVDTAFTTQIVDSVPADNVLATREQALYMILQTLQDFDISGTTLTVRKVDGTTTLMTFTLDDETSPTSITRTT